LLLSTTTLFPLPRQANRSGYVKVYHRLKVGARYFRGFQTFYKYFTENELSCPVIDADYEAYRASTLVLVVYLLTADGKIEEKSVEKGDHPPWKKCR